MAVNQDLLTIYKDYYARLAEREKELLSDGPKTLTELTGAIDPDRWDNDPEVRGIQTWFDKKYAAWRQDTPSVSQKDITETLLAALSPKPRKREADRSAKGDPSAELARIPKEVIRRKVKRQNLTETIPAIVKAFISEGVIIVPEKARRRKKPGKRADPKINDRKKIVRHHIKHKSDFNNPDIFHSLLSELDYEKIPPPIFRGGTSFDHPWIEVQDDPYWKEKVIKLLNEDRFQRRK